MVYQVKDIVTSSVNTLVPNASVQALLIVDQNGTQVHIGQERSSVPISQIQGEEENIKREPNRTKESVLNLKTKE